MMRFAAPWSKTVKIVSGLATLLILGVSYFVAGTLHAPRIAVFLPVLLLIGSALFTIRGYEIAGRDLLVQRLFWTTRIELDGLQRAWASPTAMHRSWRLFGNGGLFSISGLFRNSELGNYRALATDSKHAVVLEFTARKWVVTPDDPDRFLEVLSQSGFREAVTS